MKEACRVVGKRLNKTQRYDSVFQTNLVTMLVVIWAYILPLALQQAWAAISRQRFATDGGVLRQPPRDKPLEDYSTLHRGPRQGFVTEGRRQRFVTAGGARDNTGF